MRADPEPARRGIRNIGNTCYLNAVIQMLYSMSTFHDIFRDISSSDLAKFKRPVYVLNEEDIQRRDSSDPEERAKYDKNQKIILSLRRKNEDKEKGKTMIREAVLECINRALFELSQKNSGGPVNLKAISPNILQSLSDLGISEGIGEMNDAAEALTRLLPLLFESNTPDEYLHQIGLSKVSFSYCHDNLGKQQKNRKPVISHNMREFYHDKKKRGNVERVSIMPEVASAKKVGKGRTVQMMVDEDQKIGIVNDVVVSSCREGTYMTNLQYQVNERSKYVLVPIQRQVFHQTGDGRSAISKNANTPSTASVKVTRLVLDMDDRGERRREYTPICAILVKAGHYMFCRIKETADGSFDVTHVYNDADVHVGHDASEFMDNERLSLEKNASVLLYRRTDEPSGHEMYDSPIAASIKRKASHVIDVSSDDDVLSGKPDTKTPVIEITDSDSDSDDEDVRRALKQSKQRAFEEWAHGQLEKGDKLSNSDLRRLGFVSFGQIMGIASGRYNEHRAHSSRFRVKK